MTVFRCSAEPEWLLLNQPHEPPLERGEHGRKFVAPLEHRAMFADQRERTLLLPQCRTFLDPDLGPFAMPAKGGEDRNVGIDPQRIIAPVPRSDHPPIKVEDARQLLPIESGDRAPVPRRRERRDDAQALFTFGWG